MIVMRSAEPLEPEVRGSVVLMIWRSRTLAEGAPGDEVVNWLWKQWANFLRVRNDGAATLIADWRDVLPTQSVCLSMPLADIEVLPAPHTLAAAEMD